jgi:hypothetical protein
LSFSKNQYVTGAAQNLGNPVEPEEIRGFGASAQHSPTKFSTGSVDSGAGLRKSPAGA